MVDVTRYEVEDLVAELAAMKAASQERVHELNCENEQLRDAVGELLAELGRSHHVAVCGWQGAGECPHCGEEVKTPTEVDNCNGCGKL